MITVIKQDPAGKEITRYQGEIVRQTADETVIEAYWTRPAKDSGYTCFEPGDRFIEYYYANRWFNIFDIASPDGTRKGWYCNVAEPARIYDDHIEQIDLILDVWITPHGETLILDEDEFAVDTTLSQEQRNSAQKGLQALLALVAARVDVFAKDAFASPNKR
jgi:protein associated with RNAse G/E